MVVLAEIVLVVLHAVLKEVLLLRGATRRVVVVAIEVFVALVEVVVLVPVVLLVVVPVGVAAACLLTDRPRRRTSCVMLEHGRVARGGRLPLLQVGCGTRGTTPAV